eukprot:7978884-Alexandrium_andersonii.AAC.1
MTLGHLPRVRHSVPWVDPDRGGTLPGGVPGVSLQRPGVRACMCAGTWVRVWVRASVRAVSS